MDRSKHVPAHERFDELEERIERLEQLFDLERIPEPPIDADPEEITKDTDARRVLTTGEIRDLEVKKPPEQHNGDEALCYTKEGIVVFVDPNGVDIEEGGYVSANIKDVKESNAEAVAVA